MKRLCSHHLNRSFRAAATLVWVTLMLSPAPASAAPPVIHNLGTLGGTESSGVGINANAQVAGSSRTSIYTHAFIYTGTPGSGGMMHDLGTLGGTESYGSGINNNGQVAGSSNTNNSTERAFLYTGTPGSGGMMHDLGTLGGNFGYSNGFAINDSGQVAGWTEVVVNNMTREHAFLYTGTPGSGGVMHDLGTLGGAVSYGRGISNNGQVVGLSLTNLTSNSRQHAFLYTGTPGSGGIMHDLGTLGGMRAEGMAVNASGQVTGWSQLADNVTAHAFLYTGVPGNAGVMHDLGTLGGPRSYAHAINESGQVVGFSDTADFTPQHAFLYTGTPGVDGQMIDLHDWLNANNPTEGAKWILLHAFGISDTGWITGRGVYDPDGPGGVDESTRAYLLDASTLVPEPSGLALLALAVPALLRRRHQSRQRQAIRRACCETLEPRRLLSFSPAVNYATIGTPSAIVTADFNNDGKLDLVTCANAVTGSYSVLLGNGSGGFGAAQRTVMGSQLSSLAAADFNNDGKLDLVVSDNYDYGFDFLAGNGDGTFQPPVYTASGAVAVAGRFNGDSHTDVLIARLGPDWEIQFQVYCGDGQGGFAAVGTDLWYYGSGRTAVDLNNDGKLDVVTAEGYVFPGNGDGTFQFDWEQPALLDGGTIATGDFTGDGKVDAIVAGNNKVSVLRGRGDGTFDAPIKQPLAGNPHTGVATADFNGDGKLDAAVSSYDTGDVRLMLGNGDGTLRDGGAFATGTSPTGVAVGDFNRDGRPDVAVSNAGTSRNVSVLLNDGNWPGSKTFVGPGGGGSGGNWSTASNWSPSGVPTAGDLVTISGKSVTLSASATVAGMTLTSGASLAVAPNGNRVLRTSTLFISANSKLDLNNNDLLLDYAGQSPLASMQSLINAARAGGNWTGSGITSTSAKNASFKNTTLGAMEASAFKNLYGAAATFAGETMDTTAVLVKYTYYGDTDFNGIVDFDDYSRIDAGFNGNKSSWFNGDVDGNGIVDFDDYSLIDQAFNTQGVELRPALPALGGTPGRGGWIAAR